MDYPGRASWSLLSPATQAALRKLLAPNRELQELLAQQAAVFRSGMPKFTPGLPKVKLDLPKVDILKMAGYDKFVKGFGAPWGDKVRRSMTETLDSASDPPTEPDEQEDPESDRDS